MCLLRLELSKKMPPPLEDDIQITQLYYYSYYAKNNEAIPST
jgi:hypothetical protein